MPSPSIDQDKELAEFFTDVEHLRSAFKDAVSAPTLTKQLFVIHGVGGVGKSSLLRMFRLHCKDVNAPVALASGDEAKSAFDILARWTDDLKADGVTFSAFGKTFEHYRAIQAKVETETIKIAGQAVKGVAKTTIETAANTIPGIGSLLGKVGGTSVEALADILMSRGFKKPDIDLLLDPTRKLTDDFLNDIAKAADKQRIVLVLDTFEQMTALEDWGRDMAQRLPANVLFAIAGRALPNWGRAWDSWQKNAHVEELKPMTEDVMRELIQRYYATMRGGEPAPAQVEAIIRFARGLPMVVTSAVQLWVKYGVEDFQSVKAEIVANLVDRLMEGVPKELLPALEAAATVRWFDQPILRAVMKQDDVRDAYNELRRFPFVRSRIEGLALHDAVREIMDENLRVQDSERYCILHQHAAAYFENQLEKTIGEDAARLGLERLYHRVCANEETGIKLFQEMAEEMTRYRLINRLRALVNDANVYPLERDNSMLWRDMYAARLADMSGNLDFAAKTYDAIGGNECADRVLRGYAYSNLARNLADETIFQQDGFQRLLAAVEKCKQFLPDSDTNQTLILRALGKAYHRLGEADKALEYSMQALTRFQESGDRYGAASTMGSLLDTYATLGNWQKMFAMRDRGKETLPRTIAHSAMNVHFLGSWACARVWAGRYYETEGDVRKGETILREIGDSALLPSFLMDLGLSLGMQNKYREADDAFKEAMQIDAKIFRRKLIGILAFSAAILVRRGEFDMAMEYLKHSWELLEKSGKQRYFPTNLHLFGELSEVCNEWRESQAWYQRCLEFRWTGRRYFECGAFAGLVRVKHAQSDYSAIPPLLTEAEQLAQQYEYNDHLASLRLTQGHIAWEGNAPTWDNGFEAALHFYQHALIYGLRYNRFLLDEVLSGRPQGTPLRPIIPCCLERGDEGRQMLGALRDWWKTGVNDIGTPRPDTISPIPEGIPLMEAERIAREREPGDGSLQNSVVEQIETVLLVPNKGDQ